MGKVYQYASADSDVDRTSANTTQYWPMFGAFPGVGATAEAPFQMIMRTAGTLYHFTLRISFNTINASCVFKVRKNGADTAMTVTVPSATTGTFNDDTNTVTIAAGDKIVLQSVPGSGSTGVIGFSSVRTIFESSDAEKTVSRLAQNSDNDPSNAGTILNGSAQSVFFPLNGVHDSELSATYSESNAKCRQRRTGTFRNLAIRVRTNARTTSTTVTLRKNGANATNTITVGAGVTGWIEDTTHTDTVAVGDDFNYNIVNGSGTQTFAFDYVAVEYVSTDGYGQLIVTPFLPTDTINRSVTRLLPISGDNMDSANTQSESENTIVEDAELIFSDLTIKVRSNALDTNTTLTFRKNNADGNLLVNVPANATGVFTDSVNTDTTALGDLVNMRIVTGSGTTGDRLGVDHITLWTLDEISAPTTAVKAECDALGMEVGGEFYLNFSTADDIQRQTLWFSLSA